MAESDYPVSEKLAVIQDERTSINEFVEWLAGKGIQLCSIPPEYNHTWHPIGRTVDGLVMEFFEIDERELENERRRMLAGIAGGSDG